MSWSLHEEKRREERLRPKRERVMKEAEAAAFRKGLVLTETDDPYDAAKPTPSCLLSRPPSELAMEYRGVFEEEDAPTGYREYKVVDSEKRLQLKVLVAETHATDAFRDNLCAWLEKVDPSVVLKVI